MIESWDRDTEPWRRDMESDMVIQLDGGGREFRCVDEVEEVDIQKTEWALRDVAAVMDAAGWRNEDKWSVVDRVRALAKAWRTATDRERSTSDPLYGDKDVRIMKTVSDLTRMRACTPLLPTPGNKVVVELLDELEHLREVAENAMHVLLHVDADMTERIDTAKTVAEAIGHKWPPYEDEDDGP